MARDGTARVILNDTSFREDVLLVKFELHVPQSTQYASSNFGDTNSFSFTIMAEEHIAPVPGKTMGRTAAILLFWDDRCSVSPCTGQGASIRVLMNNKQCPSERPTVQFADSSSHLYRKKGRKKDYMVQASKSGLPCFARLRNGRRQGIATCLFLVATLSQIARCPISMKSVG